MFEFKRFSRAVALALAAMSAGILPAGAQELMGSYWAYIGNQDLYNSKGQRLTAAWQVLRQDRANFHRFGVSQPGDEWDPYFADYQNRAAMERMIMNGYIEPSAARILLNGGATVHVEIYGSRGVASSISVTVSN